MVAVAYATKLPVDSCRMAVVSGRAYNLVAIYLWTCIRGVSIMITVTEERKGEWRGEEERGKYGLT